jgi:CRP-like cAMP-binding protein
MASVEAAQRDFRFSVRTSPHLDAATLEVLASIRSSPLFADLPERATAEIGSCARPRTFARNEILFVQGQPVMTLILLQSGCVKHTQVGPSGTEVLLRFSGNGEIVDIQSESSGSGHSCSARAMENCKTLVWDYGRVQSFAVRYPQLANNISHLLYRKLGELEERFREMATENVAARLGLVLARLLQQIGKPSKTGIQISIRREELAQMTGSTIYTVSRLLSGWSEQGVVVPGREWVVVSHPEKLVRVDPSVKRTVSRNLYSTR